MQEFLYTCITLLATIILSFYIPYNSSFNLQQTIIQKSYLNLLNKYDQLSQSSKFSKFDLNSNRYSTALQYKKKVANSYLNENRDNLRINLEELKTNSILFTNRLKLRSKETYELSSTERSDLNKLIEQHVNKKLKPSSYVIILNSLASLKQLNKNLDFSNELNLILSSLPECNSLSIPEISLIFISFARLSINFHEFVQINSEFLYQLSDKLSIMNERTIGDVVWSLGSIGARWNKLPDKFKNRLMSSLSSHSSSFRC